MIITRARIPGRRLPLRVTHTIITVRRMQVCKIASVYVHTPVLLLVITNHYIIQHFKIIIIFEMCFDMFD